MVYFQYEGYQHPLIIWRDFFSNNFFLKSSLSKYIFILVSLLFKSYVVTLSFSFCLSFLIVFSSLFLTLALFIFSSSLSLSLLFVVLYVISKHWTLSSLFSFHFSLLYLPPKPRVSNTCFRLKRERDRGREGGIERGRDRSIWDNSLSFFIQ